MKTAGVAILKSRLSEFLAVVKAGGEVFVTERGRPIAKIVPVNVGDDEDRDLEELERAGLVKRPGRPLNKAFWQQARGVDTQGAVRSVLVAEREESW